MINYKTVSSYIKDQSEVKELKSLAAEIENKIRDLNRNRIPTLMLYDEIRNYRVCSLDDLSIIAFEFMDLAEESAKEGNKLTLELNFLSERIVNTLTKKGSKNEII